MCARSNEHACTSRCQNKRSFFGTAANKAGYQDFFRPLSFARVYANDNSLPSPEGEESLSAKELHRWKHSAQQLTTWTREGGRVRELEMIFDDASYKIMVCWNSGGRYWYLETDVTSSTACVPSECSADDVETHIARMFFAKLAAPGVHLQIVTTREVFHWGQLELDFAIIGMDGCGSTSVHRILSQHTEIQFTNLSVFNVDEDFFMVELGRQTLPFRSQVERLNRFRMEVRQKSGDSKVVGLYQPFMWNIELLRLAMKQMPNMRVVCTVCDPVDRFERRMYGQSKPSDHELAEAVRKQLEDDASVTLAGKWQAWQESLGHRLLFVEQLKLSTHEAWRTLTDFLQIRPFPSSLRFPRYNARGVRTTLCQHGKLLDDLKERFKAEYNFLEEVLGSEGFRRRQTHCDRLDSAGTACIKDKCPF
ncbi:unnamed protein product [Symbiodinium pilosum]|uniref:Uncharacterized protein n=1 Tax=Symbiodinium pilosum TaxID=2952 RepID=A0A812PEW6_SYMPI|nr:unnamed protein product [Symbiodinium pilosum]